jgi:hypothetical protein
MRKFAATGAALLLLLSLSLPAVSQGLFATVGGTVTDSSGALIPGVTIRATNIDTQVVATTVTNEAGAYNFADLLPGKYTLTAALPGFQTKNLTDVQLSQNTTYRYNFDLAVSGVNTQVEVSVSAGMILATQGASVGQVLDQSKVSDLPLVGNNILDLITVMAGVENIVPTNPPSAANAFGRENTTFAGVRADNISIVRDGIQMQDNRNPTGIYSITTINPDLVGEIRLILAPVDVELGRGNGSIQYSTRSGTNRFSGSVLWSFRNTALDPNTWTNNRNQTPGPNAAPGDPLAIQPTWVNGHQITASYGGPIVRNKTFFFALFDINRNKSRSSSNFVVPTACGRLGIFRYFNNWTNGNLNAATVTTGNNPSRASVSVDGTPLPPSGHPTNPNIPYDNSLQAISVFGPLQNRPSQNDCSDAPINMTSLVPNGVTVGAAPGTPGGQWDPYRQQKDVTGYINRVMAFYPVPNNFEVGDGLNTGGYRYLRHFRGVDNLWGAGEATGDREQINVKIDHNFTSNHKANVNVSYEMVDSDDVYRSLPGTFPNLNKRRPLVISGGFTSTLSTTLLNEARFGMRRQGINVIAPWHQEEFDADVRALMPPDTNGFRVITDFAPLGLCNPHSGSRPPGSGCLFTGTQYEKTPTYTFSDTLSWTTGAHAFRFNGELRLNSSETRNPTTANFGSKNATFATVTGVTTAGNNPILGITGTTPQNGSNNISNTNPVMTGLTNTNTTNARGLMGYLAGTVTNVQSLYFLSDPKNTTTWSDYRTAGEFIDITTKQVEFSAWAKDEWKITRNLTLTPGIRWDYYGVPWLESGLTAGLVGGGASAFGISGRDFTGWMNPGVRGELTQFEFVGPNSPNEGKSAYPKIFHNFGPSFAFAWQLPWFGEGRTTIRGGYQITYQGGGRFGTVAGVLAATPGSNLPVSFAQQNVYLDLATINTTIPLPQSSQPLQPISSAGPRNANLSVFDKNFTSPYVQNLTLSVTRTLNRNVTLDVRYVGTLSRKTYTSQNLNIANFLHNGLFEDFERVRTGTEITKSAGDELSLLDRIFAGVNLCNPTTTSANGTCTNGPGGSSTFVSGPIGSTVGGIYQSAAYQMRSSSTFNEDLAVAAYEDLADSVKGFNYNNSACAGCTNQFLPAIPTGHQGAALRLNGFPDNFVDTNPQFGSATIQNNSGYNNYHSFQAQLTTRPIQGFSGSINYNWSKNLGLGAIANPVERAVNYTNIGSNPGHSIRTNGTIELPIGPNKLFFGNSSGWVARAIERWQLGLIYNLSSGAPTSITAETMLYGNGLPDVRHHIDFNKIKGVRWGIPGGNNNQFLEGRYFDNGETFVKVSDPLCDTVTNLQNLRARGDCNLDALAMVVPDGTEDSFLLPDGRRVQILLQHAQPGKKGNLGNNTVVGLGSWRFDANLGKTFQITESKSLQVRFDAQNILNHPQPGNPSLNINAADAFGNSIPFGQITTKTGTRLLQGQLRLSF